MKPKHPDSKDPSNLHAQCSIDNCGATERHSISGCLGEPFHAAITCVAKLRRVYLKIILAGTQGETGLELFSIVPASIGD